MAKNTNQSWDAPENEAQNNFVSWGQVGDFVYGVLLKVKSVPSTLPDKKGQMQNVYEVKVKECSYHILDEKKRVVEEAIEPQEGEVVSVGGRSGIDSRMTRLKIGQVFGLKFVEEIPSKTKGYNPTKAIKVFTPKGKDGEYLMDQEVVDAVKADENGGDGMGGF